MNSSAWVLRLTRPQILAITLIVATLLAMPAVAFGQAYFGTVSGVLTDPTGALVAGAKVILTDQQKDSRSPRPPRAVGATSFARFLQVCTGCPPTPRVLPDRECQI